MNYKKKLNGFYIVIASILLFFQAAKAQITLEHTYEGHVYFASESMYYYGDAGLFICNSFANNLKLYNTDHSLYKNIDIAPPTDYTFYVFYSSHYTKKLFNDDDKIEFMAALYKVQNGNVIYNIRLYNEDGTMLKDFGETNTMSVNVFRINGQFKLVVQKNTTTDVYSLPGIPPTPPVGVSSQTSNEYQSPFPNPANAIITLPYQLKQGEMSVLNIYNSNGQLIETKQIGSDFDKILLNVSGYTKGMYVYEVNGVSNKFVVE